MAAMTLQVDGVCVRFGGETVLDKVSFAVKTGEIVALIGPSGCGKSTLLNCIAGFLRPDEGRICAHGADVTGPGTDRGVVFQDLALFPWLNVIDNVAFALRMRGVPKRERHERAAELLMTVGLAGREHARIRDLSGGMKQRVALARTLAMNPDVLLMDEPFSALDALTRDALQDELLRIQRQTGTTVLIVTHSIDEAVYLSGRVLLMDAGPGRIAEELLIDIVYPREPDVRTTPLFNQYKRHIMEHLRRQSADGQEGKIR
jgi:ABC-type nitrate/sulfonate/bicarbonate transport system ATPase subunit